MILKVSYKGKWYNLPEENLELEEVYKSGDLIFLELDEEIERLECVELYEFEELFKEKGLNTLLELVEKIEQEKIEFLAVYWYTGGLKYCWKQFLNEDYTVIHDINSEYDLGYYLVDEGYFGNIPDNLINYIDYELIGRDAIFGDNWRIIKKYRVAVYMN